MRINLNRQNPRFNGNRREVMRFEALGMGKLVFLNYQSVKSMTRKQLNGRRPEEAQKRL